MIVFCEECGTRNETEPESFNDEKNPARCTACHDILNKVISRKIRIELEKGMAAKKQPKQPKVKKKKKEVQASAPPKPKPGIIEPVAILPEKPELIDMLDETDLDRNLDIDISG